MNKENLAKFISLIDKKTEKFQMKNYSFEITNSNLFIYLASSCNNNCIFCPQKRYLDRSYLQEIKDMQIDYSIITDIHIAWEETFNISDIEWIIDFLWGMGKGIHIMSSLNGVDMKVLERVLIKGFIVSFTTSLHGLEKEHDYVTGNIGNFQSLIDRLEIIKWYGVEIFTMGLLLNQNISKLSNFIEYLKELNVIHIFLYPRLKSIYFTTWYMPSFADVKKFLYKKEINILWLPLCVSEKLWVWSWSHDLPELIKNHKVSFLIEKYFSIYETSYVPICIGCSKKEKCPWIPIFTNILSTNTNEITPL